MSFLDRYEFEQILDEDLTINRNQWQTELASNSQPQSLLTPKRFGVNIGKAIALSLLAASLGLTMLNRPSYAQQSQSLKEQSNFTTQQK